MKGSKITEIRAALNLTQTALAQKIGVSFPSVNKWENEKAAPSPLALEKLRAIAKQAGVEFENPKPRLRLNLRRKRGAEK
jgi:putative transcriptional regulator